MSVYEEPDHQLIEQTKRQIQALVEEIAQISRQTMAPAEFYGQFLDRVVTALAAIGGAVWTTNDDGQLALQYQINFQQTNLRDDEEKQKRHARLLYKALNDGQGMLVPPQSGFGDGDEAGNPTDFLLVFGPLRTDLEMVGIVEIFQRSDSAVNVQQGYLRFLLQMCELAGDFLKSHQLRHFSDRQVLWSRLEDFTRTVHASLNPTETAYTIANEARRLIECDRVSVALRRGAKCTIEAVSGQDVFDKRSNTVRLLGRLATAVVATGDPVWYAGDTRDLAPQVEDAVEEYVDEAHSKMIAVLPLGRPKPDQEIDRDERDDAEPPVGALIVEQIEDNRMAPALLQRVDVVCRHSSTALANAMEHQSLFLMPLWRAIGKSRFLVKARTLPKTISISVAVVVLLVLLAVWPARFMLHSKGTLEPVNRRDVFAIADGVVDQVLVKHGQAVKAGDLLIQLRNTDVLAAYNEVDGKLLATHRHVLALQGALQTERRAEERSRLNTEMTQAQVEEASLEEQHKLYKTKLRELEVRSPINGTVVTWDMEERLKGRFVQKGQVLLRVADVNEDAKWQVELHMAEDRMGFIAKAQQDPKLGYNLPVTYILATRPGKKYEGTVTEVGESAEVMGEEGNTVLIKVAIDRNEIPKEDLRPGATVNGKVYCGQRAIGYCWFHDVLAFVQSRILFKL
jgi:multidrug efflux pump subunit AcrA (membrane-fusion protein)